MLLAGAPISASHADDPETAGRQIQFDRHIRPVLAERCFACHGRRKQEAGLRLDVRSRALEGGDSGRVIEPGKPGQSELLRRIRATDEAERMPPEGEPLTAEQIAAITRWIEQGAEWPDDLATRVAPGSDHWAFRSVERPPLPNLQGPQIRNAIDRFVQARLAESKLVPSAEADRHTLVRRLYLDLIGLPPTPAELREAISDRAPNWYGRLVDRLLASPHFGERFALTWLDLGRYADSDGYEKDLPRPHAWRWRQWLLQAVNEDLPYDQFTIRQLAGDLIPGADDNTRLATGIHRNALTNREGGIDQEEFRVKTVVDRTNTTFAAWLGLTVGCAQCHSHKYDPISQREYYQLYAFFNNAEESNILLPLTDRQEEHFFQQLLEHADKARKVEEDLDAATEQLYERIDQLEQQTLAEHQRGDAATRDGLVLHLPLDGSSHDTVRDRPLGVYQSLSDPEWVKARVGRGLALHGNGYFDIETETHFDRDRAFSWGAWVNLQGGGTIISKMDDENAYRGFDVVVFEGHLLVHLVHRWPDDGIRVISKEKIAEDQWRHVFVTYDGSSSADGVKLYVNGQPQETVAALDTLRNSIVTDQPLRVGSRSTSELLRGTVDDVRVYDRVLPEEEVAQLAFDYSLLDILKLPREQRSEEQRARLLDYLQLKDPATAPLRKQLTELERSTPQRPEPLGHVMARRPLPRETHILLRGDFLRPGGLVDPDTPGFLPPLKPRGRRPDRLDLARWMVSPEHPLTARVAVNRLWAHLFGYGLVRTPEDFGRQGDPPTHPELLDWLADEFMRTGWSRKRLVRLIVTSHTYRQSSQESSLHHRRDPDNRQLARQNRLRLPAELVRDQYLAAASLLNGRVGGPSFRPPLPEGVGEVQFVNQWKADQGAEVHRRGLYVHRQRNLMLPMLTTFDHPDAITICTRRDRSNTPLQALTLLNGAPFLESARALGTHLSGQNRDDRQRIRLAYQRIVSRPPTEFETARVESLLLELRELYAEDRRAAGQLVGQCDTNNAAIEETAAWIALARTLLNLDEAITRE
jgi:mono/diheme cytochrome c family protein